MSLYFFYFLLHLFPKRDLIKTDDDVNKIALDLGESTLDVLESFAEEITNPLVGIIKCLKLGAKLLNKYDKNIIFFDKQK